MAQPDFYTMCATVFASDGSFDESAMRLYLRRQIDARLEASAGRAKMLKLVYNIAVPAGGICCQWCIISYAL